MSFRKLIGLLFVCAAVFPAFSQGSGVINNGAKNSMDNPLIIPILETIFSGEVNWRPEWPLNVPPDAFIVKGGKRPSIIELWNGENSLILRRDNQGRITRFPYFYENGYADVSVLYAASGAIQRVNMTRRDLGESGSPEEMAISIDFPRGFLPYSDLSPGGAFPPLTVTSGAGVFFIVIFESPLFLSETWYDSNENCALFSKASVMKHENGWKIRTSRVFSEAGLFSTDYYHDSYGNVTEINALNSVISALYRENRPYSLNRWETLYEFQWDTQGILTTIRASTAVAATNPELLLEYRYGYVRDAAGNWVQRRETAYFFRFHEVFASDPSYSGGIWNRRIVY